MPVTHTIRTICKWLLTTGSLDDEEPSVALISKKLKKNTAALLRTAVVISTLNLRTWGIDVSSSYFKELKKSIAS